MRSFSSLFIGILVLVIPTSTWAQHISNGTLRGLAYRYPFFHVLETKGQPDRFVYADRGRFIRVYESAADGAELVWVSPVLGSQVTSLIVADIGSDKVPDILVSTRKGRILGWNGETFDLIGENLVEPFDNVSCMAVGQLDNRGGLDAVFIAEGQLNIYDTRTTQRIWRSSKPYAATEILLANVDTDEQLEIILNSGYIIDSRFYKEEIFFEEGFGTRMYLLDMNGDGFPEIIGETPGWALIVYDVYSERELFPDW